jgi:2-keto-4-pentenoate hydratase/2-oxohepta-3-ene-1,7-dioic acid hydratase in catechol pathway
VAKYIRYRNSSMSASYGLVEGDHVREIRGDPFGTHSVLQAIGRVADLTLLNPCQPTKIVAVGRNYRSHLGDRVHPQNPEIFYKPLSSMQDPEAPIVIPRDATNVHYEGELVVVVGKRLKNATPEEARAAVFGVTCGNDVTDRDWQYGAQRDVQWWRAKGSDTFAPAGPFIVTGLDPDNLLVQTRVNGQVVQSERTSDFIFDCATFLTWISGWVTLMPGDIVYTGTPGATRRLSPGDVVEVEVEGVGVLRNPVV